MASRAELAAYFRRRASERIDELGSLRARRQPGGTGGADATEAIRSAAHQLAGTAASFGFPSIGELARALEHAGEASFDAALDDLLQALEAVGTGSEPADGE